MKDAAAKAVVTCLAIDLIDWSDHSGQNTKSPR